MKIVYEMIVEKFDLLRSIENDSDVLRSIIERFKINHDYHKHSFCYDLYKSDFYVGDDIRIIDTKHKFSATSSISEVEILRRFSRPFTISTNHNILP